MKEELVGAFDRFLQRRLAHSQHSQHSQLSLSQQPPQHNSLISEFLQSQDSQRSLSQSQDLQQLNDGYRTPDRPPSMPRSASSMSRLSRSLSNRSSDSLSRSGSNLSRSSSRSSSTGKRLRFYSSSSSGTDTEDYEESQAPDEEYEAQKKRKRRTKKSKKKNRRKKIKRRRPSNPQKVSDKKVVSGPVLDELDKRFLAPLRSPLFKRFYKRKRNVHGQFELKKNPDIVMSLCRRLLKPILQRILGDAAMTDKNLVDRYFAAAIEVIRKRRANHVQH